MKKTLILLALFVAACGSLPNLTALNPPAQTNASIEAAAPVAAPTAIAPATAATPASSSLATAVFDIRATYDSAFLVPASKYRALPLCGAPGATVVCANPDVVRKLQAADLAAKSALDLAEGIARGTTSSGLGGGSFDAALAHASDLVSAAENLLVSFNIH